MAIFLSSCLILVAALLVFTCVRQGKQAKTEKISANRIFLFCLLFGAVLVAGSVMLGFSDDFLTALVLILMFSMGWLVWQGIRKHRHELSLPAVIILSVYLIAVLWITLFSRDGSSNTKVLLSFGKLKRFLRTGELGEFRHVLLNVLMFMPLGFLLPRLCKGRLQSVLFALAAGLWLTATIESIQYLLVIGQCDLEDLIGNTLGSVAGYLLGKLFRRIA